ncbi:MAG: c-type cytochrome [Thermoanaerobaculia bacterium]|jgi:mono/diheme cytochrome c family protein
MKKNKHLLLWSSLGVLALLAFAAIEENFFKEWRRLQLRVAAQAEGGLDVKLRQVVVPSLNVMDRCVSCHVGMAPGEAGIKGDEVLGAHKPVVHDPAEFGCTVCHGGQGRATDRADAHGDARFWPEPMIPAKYAEAGCGTCHTNIEVPNLELVKRGARLVERYDCLSCHALDARGGTLRPLGAATVVSPDLTYVGIRGYDKGWYDKHVAKRAGAADGPWHASFGEIPDADREALRVLLDSRVGTPRLVEGKALFHTLGCRGCHKIGGVGGEDGPELTREGEKDPGLADFTHVPGPRTLESWFKEHFRAPASVVPGSKMPEFSLTEEQIDLLTLYMFSLRRSDLPEAYWPKDRIRVVRFGASEFSRDGETLYGTFCSSCHGPEGQGMRFAGMTAFPAISSEGFLSLASDRFIAETIRKGRPGRRMAAWGHANGMNDDEIGKVVAYIRGLGNGIAPTEPDDLAARFGGDKSRGSALYTEHCSVCHGKTGEGGEGPALGNKVLLASATDRYMAETIRLGRPGTSMPTFGMASTVRPALAPDEIASIVAHIRSWEETR